VISADHQYDTLDEQVDRFVGYLGSLTRREALHSAGVRSNDFWLCSAL